MAFGFFTVQCSCRPYRETSDNVLKAVAEASLFLTLFISVVLRTDLGKEALTADSYGGLLVANLLAAPTVEALFLIAAVVRYCRSKKIEPNSAKYGAKASEERDTMLGIDAKDGASMEDSSSKHAHDPNEPTEHKAESDAEARKLPDILPSQTREPREP